MYSNRLTEPTLQPCTVRDFLNYLIYIEHSAENLQFFLWLRSYNERFHAARTSDIALAPEWTQELQDETFSKLQKEHRDGLKRDPTIVAGVFKGTDFEKRGNAAPQMLAGKLTFPDSNPFCTPPQTPQNERAASSLGGSESSIAYRTQANEAFAAAGIKAPCKLRPSQIAGILCTKADIIKLTLW